MQYRISAVSNLGLMRCTAKQFALTACMRKVPVILDAMLRDATPRHATISARHPQDSRSYLWRPVLRDPDDEMVLEAAVNGRADLLLTFNRRDFAGSERFGVRVERPGPAWQAWQGGRT